MTRACFEFFGFTARSFSGPRCQPARSEVPNNPYIVVKLLRGWKTTAAIRKGALE